MVKTKKKVQVGNFLVFKESNGEYLKVETVSKNWNMRIHCSSANFGLLTALANDKSNHAYLEAYIKMIYCLAMSFPDKDFMGEFFKSYTNLNERQIKRMNSEREEEK